MIENIIKKIKKDTNNLNDITYREKYIKHKKVYIIFNETIVSSDKVSEFILFSLNHIKYSKNIIQSIEEKISNFKAQRITTYEDIIFYLNNGFTIILVENESTFLALETKANLNRSISNPTSETTIRGAKDSFIENYQTNIGLIKRRLKTNKLWSKDIYIGELTKTKTSILYIEGLADKKLINNVAKELEKLKINGLVEGEVLKNILDKKNKTSFPTIQTTERPDIVTAALLNGRIVIMCDNSCYALIIPTCFTDLLKTSEDFYSKNVNVSVTRILKLIAFLISLLGPSIYIALITYNQEILPFDLLINFATQRDGVPFPAIIEAFFMIFAFEIIKEADLRSPSTAGGALSIVGALILGDAAVSAGIVSPIMIIIVAITALCSLLFNEFELANTLRLYRILFMIGTTLLGIIGIVCVFIYFLIMLCSLESFESSYLRPLIPLNKKEVHDSIIKFGGKNEKA